MDEVSDTKEQCPMCEGHGWVTVVEAIQFYKLISFLEKIPAIFADNDIVANAFYTIMKKKKK